MALVISYDTYVGVSIESSSETPYFEGATGTDPSSYGNATPQAFLPISGEASLETALNFVEIPQPEQAVYHSKYQVLSRRAEGGLSVVVPPGLLGGPADFTPGASFTLKKWLYDRFSQGTTGVAAANQCLSATVWVNVGGFCKKFVGVKISTADFSLAKGQPLVVNMNATGFGQYIVSPPSFSAPTWWPYAVYGGDGATLNVGDENYANLAESTNVDSINWTVNNKVDDDPHRLWNSPYPRRYYNRDREVTGNFEADFLSSALFVKFLGYTRSSIQTVLSRRIGGSYSSSTGAFSGGTVYTATIGFPKARFETTGGIQAGGPKDRIIKQQFNFRADGSVVSGDTNPTEIEWA